MRRWRARRILRDVKRTADSRRRDGTGPAAARPRQAGLSLVEILVAVAILALGIVAIAGIFPASSGIISRAGRETTAVQVAQGQIERLRREPWASVALTLDGAPCPQFDPAAPPDAFGGGPVGVFSEGVDRNYAIWVCVTRPFSAANPPNLFLREIAVAVVYRNVGAEVVDTVSAYSVQAMQP